MRGNGLRAASYAALADLDPRIADVLLEALACTVSTSRPSGPVSRASASSPSGVRAVVYTR